MTSHTPEPPTTSLAQQPVPAPLVLVLPDDRVVEANEAAAALFGRDITGLLFAKLIAPAMTAETLARQTQPAEFEVLAAGGAVPVLATTAVGPAGASIILQDVSAARRRERLLRNQIERMERSAQAKSRFFAAASHDLRQPLQALALFVSALETHVATDTARTILNTLKSSLRALESMFEDLLDMSKLEAGVLKYEIDEFLVNDVLEELESEFRPQAEASRLRFTVMPTSLGVRTDRRLLGRIIRNFLANAVRYTRSGGILVGCRRRGRNVRIEVWDSGPGIAPDKRQAIFEEFYQAEPLPGSSSGLGLGLAIVQRFARLLQHPLDVRSEVGRGSVFAVEVPMAESLSVDYDEDSGDEEEAAPDVRGCTVLVIDDDLDILEGLRLVLQEWGCHVHAAADGGKALALLSEEGLEPHILLADLQLQVGSGVEALDAISRSLPQPVPAFVFTGETDPATIGKATGYRYPVMRKPLNLPQLRAVLAEALAR